MKEMLLISDGPSIELDLLSKGIYTIMNKQINMVYVGETKYKFLVSWIEPLMSIPKYEEKPRRIHLFLNRDTKFTVL